MTSKIKVDNINKVSDDSNIINKCGTTITLGASGDSINLAAGASQTGFGRTGTVDWITTPKTSTFTGVSGNGYFINSGTSLTCNLPAGTAGDIISFSDYARNFNTYNFIVSPNGSEKIGGVAQDATLNVNGQAATFVYVDSTKGWVNIQNAENTETGQVEYITASVSGSCNTLTDDGDYKIATFKTPGTFCVSAVSDTTPARNIADYLVVAGGGAGGGGCGAGGGGGAGGFRFRADPSSNPQTGPAAPLNAPAGLTLTAQPYAITVGGGGPSPTPAAAGIKGSDSVFATITSTGGGYGTAGLTSPPAPGGPGGSGGGSSRNRGGVGSGNDPSVSPPQGMNSGSSAPNGLAGSGGGGALVAGDDNAPRPGASSGYGGDGGAGAGLTGFGTTGIPSGGQYYFSGGGAGGSFECSTDSPQPPGSSYGGLGGGGDGSLSDRLAPQGLNVQIGEAGTSNTGGGGGGGGEGPAASPFPGNDAPGGNGGSGIVVIRYKFQN